MTPEIATVICLDRIITLGQGYITQTTWHPIIDEIYDSWICGAIKSGDEYIKKSEVPPFVLREDLVLRLIEKGWLDKAEETRGVTIWKVNEFGLAYHSSGLLSGKA